MLTYTFGLKVELRPESDAHDIAESIEHYLNFNGIHAIHKEYEDLVVWFNSYSVYVSSSVWTNPSGGFCYNFKLYPIQVFGHFQILGYGLYFSHSKRKAEQNQNSISIIIPRRKRK